MTFNCKGIQSIYSICSFTKCINEVFIVCYVFSIHDIWTMDRWIILNLIAQLNFSYNHNQAHCLLFTHPVKKPHKHPNELAL